jgi:molybdenum cofactor biosynthesis enzyme MoaA
MSWDFFQSNRTIPSQHKMVSCYAPFNHMRIRRNGEMHPCCFSTQKTRWKKDEVSLKDYWFGELNQSYQEALLENTLHNGCQKVCGARINSKIKPPINEYDHNVGDDRLKHALSLSYPRIFEFEISNLCNMACPMCMGELSSKHMLGRDKNLKVYDPNTFDDDENLQSLLEEFKEFVPHLDEIRFVGGEPFSHKALYKLCSMIAEINPSMRIQVCTNGSVFNKKVLKICNENNLKLTISVDTVVPEEYSQIRIGGNYEETYNNVKRFGERCKVTVNATLMSINALNIDKLFEYAMENEYGVFINTYDRSGRSHTEDWSISTMKMVDRQASVDRLTALLGDEDYKRHYEEIRKIINLL